MYKNVTKEIFAELLSNRISQPGCNCGCVFDDLESELLDSPETVLEYLDEYLAAAATVGGESVKKEPGVICIYPSHLKSDKCQIRILEIYRDQEAYQSHIASEHFQIYKQGTLHMVKNLELIDMNPLDPEAMQYIFRK